MRKFLNNWRSPILSHLLAYSILVVGLPYLFHQIYHQHSLTLALMGVASIFSLFALAYGHSMSTKFPALLAFAASALVWWTWPREQLGNWNLQLADHILLWSLAAFVFSGIVACALLYRSNSRA